MPKMDGFAATAAIRKKEKGSRRHIPMIAMTAHAMAAIASSASMPEWTPISLNRSGRQSCFLPSNKFNRVTSSADANGGVADQSAISPLSSRHQLRRMRTRHSTGPKALAGVGGSEAILQELVELFR